MQTLSAAFKYLTIWHFFATVQPNSEIIGRAAKYFPLVGLVLGLTLALVNYLLAPYLHSAILSVALIAFLIVLNGGRHLEGLKQTFAEFGTKAPGDDGGAYESLGVAAIVFVILFKSAAAESMDEKLTLSLLLTPVLARWALLTFLYGDHSRFDKIPKLIAEQVTFSQLFAGTAATLALTAYFLGRKGLWIALIISLFTLLTRSLLHRRHAVLTHAHLGAVVELGEALSLILLAL
ncbi:MAG: adenosylcobinamide-GDP ribazoletransferase [Candidatus Binatia bacterium]